VNGNLYYANAEDNQIYVYNLSGGLRKQFGKFGTGVGEFNCPSGIDINDQCTYIADCGNNRVQVFHLGNCTYSHQWGSEGSADGQFLGPHELRFFQDLCYVGDRKGVHVFTKDGEFCYRFGKSQNEFSGVRGILVVGHRLYVSDYGGSRLVVYD